MDRYEYMRIPIFHIPVDIMEQYQLAPLIVNGSSTYRKWICDGRNS